MALPNGLFTHDATTAPPAARGVLDLFSLAGRTAVVTGGGGGIGLAVSEALAEAGAHVAIWYRRDKDKADKAARGVEERYGVQCRAYQIDISSSLSAVRSALSHTLAEFPGAARGRLDVFVANAGVAWMYGALLDSDGAVSGLSGKPASTEALYRDVVATNLDGTAWCAQAAAEVWRRQKKGAGEEGGEGRLDGFDGGSFVATASMSGHIVNVPQLQAAYNASKAAVVHLCRSLAVEWVGFARCNSVSPGYIVTEISDFVPPETRRIWKDKIPMGREGQTRELKGVYLYLASDASTYTTGTDIIVDGGYCLP